MMWGVLANAQLSQGGHPAPMDNFPNALKLKPIQQPLAKQSKPEALGKVPFRFAEPIYTALSPENSGEWSRQGDKYIWRMVVQSEGAKSLNLIFDRFNLRHGEQLFAYNPDRSHVLGAFTNVNNNPSGLFAIAPVAGDVLILELQTPYPPDSEHDLLVSAVNHDYVGVLEVLKDWRDYGYSCDEQVNAVCKPINTDEVNRAVCKIMIDGAEFCSGTMVANSKKNGKPYFLTAAHCFKYLNLTAQNVIFYFSFESSTCDPTTVGTDVQTLSGAQLEAYMDDLDFALLRLDKMPPADYHPYWVGWTLDKQIDNVVYTVHHPNKDIKKVSVSQAAPIPTTFDFYGLFRSDAHWLVEQWQVGTTEGGSSGAGLFTDSHKLIGYLSGGEAGCGNPVNDYFGRLNKAWDSETAINKQLKYWLDDADLGVNSISGYDFYADKLLLSHYHEGDVKTLYRDVQFDGSLSGHNSLHYTAYAERYDGFAEASIAGVYLRPAQVESAGSNQTFNLKIWKDVDGLPGEELWKLNDVPLGEISTAQQLFVLDEPVVAEGSVFVGVELSYDPVSVDTLALYQVLPQGKAPADNTAFILDNQEWKPYNTLHPQGDNGAYLIDLLIVNSEVGTDDDSLKIANDGIRISPNPIRNGVLKFTSDYHTLRQIEVYGLNGRRMKAFRVRNPRGDSFDVADLPPGIYLVRFKTETHSVVKKVLLLN